MPPPEKNLGPPRNAEGAPIPKTDTPTDHSNTDINSIRTPVSRYTGPWLVDFALNRIALAPVIPL